MPVHVWTENTYACSFSWVLIGYNIDGMLSCNSLSLYISTAMEHVSRNTEKDTTHWEEEPGKVWKGRYKIFST